MVRGSIPLSSAAVSSTVFKELTASVDHSCALRASDGQAFCWGSNLVGEGGWGQTNNWARSPIAVVNTYKYDMIVAGGHHTVGRTTAGALVAWGMNAQGQLGNGTTTPASSPIPILP